MRKTKVIAYALLILVFMIASVVLLIWKVKTGDSTESFLPLLMLVVTAVTCSILLVLDAKEK